MLAVRLSIRYIEGLNHMLLYLCAIYYALYPLCIAFMSFSVYILIVLYLDLLFDPSIV